MHTKTTIILLALALSTSVPTASGSELDDVFGTPIPEGIPREPEYNNALLAAIAANDIASVRKLLAGMSQEEMQTEIYLETAAEAGLPEIMELLVMARKTPESRQEAGDAALKHAALQGNEGIVRHLLAKKIGDPAWAVCWAAENGDIPVADILIKAGASEDEALCSAAMTGQSDFVRHLLDTHGADADAADSTLRSTALALAAMADPGNTSEHLWKAKRDTIEILLQHGAAPDKGEEKPLLLLCGSWRWVAPRVRVEILDLLIGAGADVFAEDAQGQTPRDILTGQRDGAAPGDAADYDTAIDHLRAAEKRSGSSVRQNELALSEAIGQGDLERLKSLLAYSTRGTDTAKLIRAALDCGHSESIDFLMAALPTQEDRAAVGTQALIAVAHDGQEKAVRCLLSKNIGDPTIAYKNNVWSMKVGRLLKEAGARDICKPLPRPGARRYNCHAVDYSALLHPALLEAVRNGRTEDVRKLLSAHPQEAWNTLEYMEAAVRGKHADVIQLLVECKPVPAKRAEAGDTALGLAARHGDAQLVQSLLAKGIGAPSAALEQAAASGDVGIGKLLLAAGADVRHNRNAALFSAAQNAQADFVRFLLDSGADAKVCEKNGESCLSYAIMPSPAALAAAPAQADPEEWKQRTAIAKLLLERGASPHAGNTPPLLWLALYAPYIPQEARLELAQALLSAGADVNALPNGITPAW